MAFIMEQTLGHVTHYRNLLQYVEADCRIDPEWLLVPYEADDRWQRMPVTRTNWSLRASLRARGYVSAMMRKRRPAGLFYHTQVTSLLSTSYMRSIPTIISMDATPLNVDTVGSAYNHAPSELGPVEAMKNALNRRAYRSARHLITWCDWAKQSLIADYGIAPEKITVIPPGVDMQRWSFEKRDRKPGGPVRLLFVGGDFQRKGGETLLKAFNMLPKGTCELDIVTKEDVRAEDMSAIRVHHGLTSNAPELLSLYRDADMFVFPTEGDCLPIAIMEAMASGLPVIATNVGAIREEVEDGVTGITVPIRDANALNSAVQRLIDDPDLRTSLGIAGKSAAQAKFDGARNYQAVLELYKRYVDGGV